MLMGIVLTAVSMPVSAQGTDSAQKMIMEEVTAAGQPGAGVNPGEMGPNGGQPGENAASDGMGPGGIAPDGMGSGGAAPGGTPPRQSQGPESYDAVTEITEDTVLDGEQIDSTGTDESAVLISGSVQASLSNLTVTRTSEESTGGDNASFYGVGAAVLATGGTTYLTDSTITTDAAGGSAICPAGQ